VTEQTFDAEQQTYTIELGSNLVVTEEYDIDISFVARVADDRLDGLYLSQYVDQATGVTKWVV